MANSVTRCAALLSMLLFGLATTASAQERTGVIGGVVSSATGGTLRGVEISLEGTDLQTLSSADGRFVMLKIPAGTYTMVARSLGYAAVSRIVSVEADRATRVEISMSVEAIALGEITVLGVRAYGRSTTGVEKGGAHVMDVAQSTVVITEDFLADQNAMTLDDLLRNIGGLTPFSDYQDFTARGFRQGEDDIAYNGVKANAANYFTTPNLYNVEKVEVLKGPASVLYGDGEGGATINVVTKSPRAQPTQAFSVTVGSFDEYVGTADLTGPLSDRFLYRVTAHYKDAGSFRRFQGIQEWHVAPSVTYLPWESTQLTLKGEITQDDRQGHRNRGIAAPDGDLNALPIGWTANEPTDRASSDAYTAELNLQQDFGANWRVNATTRYAYSEYKNQYHEPRGFRMIDDRLMMIRQFRNQSFNWKNLAGTAHVTGVFNTGPLSHRLLTNWDVTVKKRETAPNDYAADVSPLDVYNPQYGGIVPEQYAGIDPVDNPVTRDNRNWGISVQDVITVIPAIKVMVGGRYNDYHAYSENFRTGVINEHKRSAYTYRGGLVLQPASSISVYGNFSEGFKPQTNNYENRGGPFDPLITRQMESGVKASLFEDRLIATTSAYRITKHNVLVPDPDPESDLLVTLGEVRSEGWELDVVGSITPQWSVTANYANNHTKISKDPRENQVGRRFPNAPKDAAAIWSRYDFPSIHVGVALGGSYVDKRETFDDTILPEYIVFDGALYYDWRNYGISLNVKNLTDKRHFTGGYNAYTIWPGTPRAFQLTVRARY